MFRPPTLNFAIQNQTSRIQKFFFTTNQTQPTTQPQSILTMSNAELATSYAALILADDGVDITADKLMTLIKAANIDDVEPIWTSLFAKALEGKDVKDLLLNVGSGGGAAAPAAGGAAAGGDAVAAAPKEEEKEEAKEESDEDMGFGLFD
ncbi:hypothetical protein LZ554_007513 [Drepanopeziza brunnea f. sp. 'monogermtubi']|nr:hypothetical protein LZ554_007513 [Drepanopeziza brunnea f. sp. 'monogermtubi']